MAFKMNGSPAKMGMIKGTAGHSSALKQKKKIDRVEEMRKAEEKREKRRKEIEEGMLNPFNPHEHKYDPNKKHIVEKKSPAKQKQQTSEAAQLLRQKQIDAVDAKIETLEEQIFNEEITQEQYDEAMKPLRIKEKQVKKPL